MVPFFILSISVETRSPVWRLLAHLVICNEVTYLTFAFRFIMSEFKVILDSPFSAKKSICPPKRCLPKENRRERYPDRKLKGHITTRALLE